MTSAERSTRTEIYSEPLNAEPRPPDFVGLALKPIRRGSCSVEHTDVKSFRSRRSVTEYSDHTARSNSIPHEPSKWAISAMSKPAALYASPPVKKGHTPLRKNLRYAGKRVIMAIRVKKALSGTDKLELMRLMLLKATTAQESTHHQHKK